jgi:hypothetical protein
VVPGDKRARQYPGGAADPQFTPPYLVWLPVGHEQGKPAQAFFGQTLARVRLSGPITSAPNAARVSGGAKSENHAYTRSMP